MHVSMTIIRRRLPKLVFHKMFAFVLSLLDYCPYRPIAKHTAVGVRVIPWTKTKSYLAFGMRVGWRDRTMLGGKLLENLVQSLGA